METQIDNIMAKVKIADNSNETKRTQDETEANIDARLIEFLQQTEGLMKTSNEEKSRIVTQEPEATTIAEVFEQALREVPARGTAAKNLNLSNVVQEGDPYEKKRLEKVMRMTCARYACTVESGN